MAPFPFRETRIESNLPIWLGLQTITSQQVHPGKVEATIINVSKGGACLITPKLLVEGKHFFFSSLNSNHSLLLESHDSEGALGDFSLTARSVWMDSCQHMDKQFFKVGVSFLSPQKQFFDAVKKHMRE